MVITFDIWELDRGDWFLHVDSCHFVIWRFLDFVISKFELRNLEITPVLETPELVIGKFVTSKSRNHEFTNYEIFLAAPAR